MHRYDGRVYNGSLLVNGLITLGTPHVRLKDDLGRSRELPFSRNFKVTPQNMYVAGILFLNYPETLENVLRLTFETCDAAINVDFENTKYT